MSGEDFDKREFNKRETSQSSSRFGIRDLVSDIDRKIDEKAESLIATELQIPQKIQKILNDGAMKVRINLPADIKNKSPNDNYYGNGTWQHVFDKFTALLKEEGLLVYFTHQGRGGCCRVPTEDTTRTKCGLCQQWSFEKTDCIVEMKRIADMRPHGDPELLKAYDSFYVHQSRAGFTYCKTSLPIQHPCENCNNPWFESTEKVYHSILIKIKPR